MKKKISLYIIFLLLSSCSINGNFAGLYSYYNKTKTDNPKLFQKTNNQFCKLKYDGFIYLINGEKLKSCLNDNNKSLVYIWRPKCSSKICVPLNVIQKLCDEKNIKLYIVAEYYDGEVMQKKYEIEKPIFGIDTEFYKSNLTKKYLNSFIKDLSSKDDSDNKYLYFKSGKFYGSYENVDFIDFL